MAFRETDLAINMVKEKRRDDNKETFATRSVALPYMPRGLHTQQPNTNALLQTFHPIPQAMQISSLQNASKPHPIPSYRLLPVSDSVLKPENTNSIDGQQANDISAIPSTVASYSEDLRMVHKIKEGTEYQEYSISNYSPNDEIDEGYRTNSSVASGSPSACSVASFEGMSPRDDSNSQQAKNDEKVNKIN